jgi:hypothetical protein
MRQTTITCDRCRKEVHQIEAIPTTTLQRNLDGFQVQAVFTFARKPECSDVEYAADLCSDCKRTLGLQLVREYNEEIEEMNRAMRGYTANAQSLVPLELKPE